MAGGSQGLQEWAGEEAITEGGAAEGVNDSTFGEHVPFAGHLYGLRVPILSLLLFLPCDPTHVT